MKVKEFVEELQKLDQEAKIEYWDNETVGQWEPRLQVWSGVVMILPEWHG